MERDMAITLFLDHFLEITWIAHAFLGIKIAVGILILDAAIKMIQKMQKKWIARKSRTSERVSFFIASKGLLIFRSVIVAPLTKLIQDWHQGLSGLC